MVIRIVQKLNPDEVNMSNKYIETIAANSRPDSLLIDAFKTIDTLTKELDMVRSSLKKSEEMVDKLRLRNYSLADTIALNDVRSEYLDALNKYAAGFKV